MLGTLSEIHSCISWIEQAAGLPFNLPTEIGDLAFQFCDMGLRDAFLRLTSLS